MTTRKTWEELDITDDYLFKLIMNHKHICKRMIEKILRIKIRDLRYIEEEKTLKHQYDSKGVRLDVYVEDDQNTVYDIEMQVRKPYDDSLAKRTRYYQAMIDLDLLQEGASYKQLNPSFIIFLCPFPLFDGLRHIYTFRSLCLQDPELDLNDGATRIFLSSKGTMDDVAPDVANFLSYMNGTPSNDEFVQEIAATIQQLKMNEEERMNYMTFEMKLNEEREEGREEGREQGRIKGFEEIAIKMLHNKTPILEIQTLTGLPESRILELAKENNLL